MDSRSFFKALLGGKYIIHIFEGNLKTLFLWEDYFLLFRLQLWNHYSTPPATPNTHIQMQQGNESYNFSSLSLNFTEISIKNFKVHLNRKYFKKIIFSKCKTFLIEGIRCRICSIFLNFKDTKCWFFRNCTKDTNIFIMKNEVKLLS